MKLFLLLLTLSVVGCARTLQSTFTKPELDYLTACINTPYPISMANRDADSAWSRAEQFVSRYGVPRIQAVSSTILKTERPTQWGEFGYCIRRSMVGDSTLFAIRVEEFGIGSATRKNMIEQIVAHYMESGHEPPASLLTNYDETDFSLLSRSQPQASQGEHR